MGRGDATTRTELLPGAHYLLTLKTLARLGPVHGYGIAQDIEQTTEEATARGDPGIREGGPRRHPGHPTGMRSSPFAKSSRDRGHMTQPGEI